MFRPSSPRQLSSMKYRHGEFSSRKLCRYIRRLLLLPPPVWRGTLFFRARSNNSEAILSLIYRGWFRSSLPRDAFHKGGGLPSIGRTAAVDSVFAPVSPRVIGWHAGFYPAVIYNRGQQRRCAGFDRWFFDRRWIVSIKPKTYAMVRPGALDDDDDDDARTCLFTSPELLPCSIMLGRVSARKGRTDNL